MQVRKQYALYKGDSYIYSGTIKELADYINVSERTIKFYSTPTHKRRSGIENNCYDVFKIDYDPKEKVEVRTK